MLMGITLIPLALGLIVVIMSAVKKLRPQPVLEEVKTEKRREGLNAAIRSDSENDKVSLTI